MPSMLATTITLTALALASLTSAAGISVKSPIGDVAKRDINTWTAGLSSCPCDNNARYTSAEDGSTWRVSCDVDTEVGGYLADISPGNVKFEDCVDTCANNSGTCQRAVWRGSFGNTGPCFLKGQTTGGTSGLVPSDSSSDSSGTIHNIVASKL